MFLNHGQKRYTSILFQKAQVLHCQIPHSSLLVQRASPQKAHLQSSERKWNRQVFRRSYQWFNCDKNIYIRMSMLKKKKSWWKGLSPTTSFTQNVNVCFTFIFMNCSRRFWSGLVLMSLNNPNIHVCHNCRVTVETRFCGDTALHCIKRTDITYEIAQFNTFISKLKMKMSEDSNLE